MEKAFFKRVLGKPRDCHQKLHKPYYKVFYLRPYPSFHSSCPLFVFVFHSFHSTTNLSFQEWKKYSAWEPLISTAQGVVQPHNTPEYCAYRSHCSPFPLLTTTLLLQRKCYDFRASERTSSLETKLAPPGWFSGAGNRGNHASRTVNPQGWVSWWNSHALPIASPFWGSSKA